MLPKSVWLKKNQRSDRYLDRKIKEDELRTAASYSLAVLFLCTSALAQKSQIPPPAPIPPQIAAARKIFISNAGGESFETVFDQVVFNGGPDRAYNQLYAAMKSWGQRELVSSPADADLIFEISWVLNDTGLGRLPVLGQVRLVMIDAKTRTPLWTVMEYVRGAVLLGNRDKNFDQAMNTIVGRVKTLMLPLPANTEAK
jgi:hypothetical protein